MKTLNTIKSQLFVLFSAFFLLASGQAVNEKSPKFLVYKFDIKEQIAKPVWRITQKSFDEAQKLGADLIVVHMNT